MTTASNDANEAEATRYLESFLGKTFHVTSLDGRIFVGPFRCVDNENNIIISNAYEYRMPSEKARREAQEKAKLGLGPALADMTSRFLGMIVIPGKQVVKIEVEEKLQLGTAALPIRSRVPEHGEIV